MLDLRLAGRARPATRKAGRLMIRFIIQARFCPKNPVRKLSGRKMVAMMVSCFMTTFKRFTG